MGTDQGIVVRLTVSEVEALQEVTSLASRFETRPGFKHAIGSFTEREWQQIREVVLERARQDEGAFDRQRFEGLYDRIVACEQEPSPAELEEIDSSDSADVVKSALALWVIVAANFVVLIAMSSDLSSGTSGLVRWGADFGPRTLGGEWWRMITSSFVHIGVGHVVFNMAALVWGGRLVERAVGPLVFVVVYLVAGILSSVASLAWHPWFASCGASGAVFGIYGFALALILDHPAMSRQEAFRYLGAHQLPYMTFGFVMGFLETGVSNAGHIGGVVAGMAMGLLYRSKLRHAFWNRAIQALRLALIGVVVAACCAALLPTGTVSAGERYEAVTQAMNRLIHEYNGAATRMDADDRDGAELQRVIVAVLPRWRAVRSELNDAAAATRPVVFSKHFRAVGDFMRVQESSWEAILIGLRSRDRRLTSGRGERLRREAVETLKDAGEWPDPSAQIAEVTKLRWRPN